jgi:hypothetical protein
LTSEIKALISLIGFAGMACAPDLGPPSSLVNSPRILAVRGSPPEALPGGPSDGGILYDVLAVTPEGRVSGDGTSWDYCTTPLPPTTNNVIAPECLDGGVASIGPDAPTASAKMPQNACSIYGPDQPPPVMGQPPARPPDPDATGGYYQPLLLGVTFPGPDGGFYQAAGLERVQCNLPDAPLDISKEYNSTYTRNQNPVLLGVTASLNGGSTTPLVGAGDGGAAVPFAVPVGGSVVLQASWPSSSVESFPVFDRQTRTLITESEILSVAWYATTGTMEFDLTVRAPENPSTIAENTWTAPDAGGLTHVWVVLRDDRGGVDFGEYAFQVQ